MVVMPRSEINRVTGAPFNRAVVEFMVNGLTVHTIEFRSSYEAIEAFYEFTPALDPISAASGDRYWDMHRALEAQGKIGHTRAQCPDREGPRRVEIFEPGTGWRSVEIRAGR